MNDGNDDSNDCELAVAGMLNSSGCVCKPLFNGIDSGWKPCVIVVVPKSSWEKVVMGVV